MHDLLPKVIFYLFASLTVFAAIMVVIQKNPVRCVLFLVLAFFTSAVLWLLVQAEFLALILVLVYVGAVMTLFLFVVMILNIDIESASKRLLRYLPLGLIIVALLVGILLHAIPLHTFTHDLFSTSIGPVNPLSDTAALGMVLYTDYVFAFELAAVILLVAIIAAITLVHREPRQSKRQNIRQQILTSRNERVKLVKMKAER